MDYFQNGVCHIVSSSHNDIAWWNTPYKTMEYRDLSIITPAIEMALADPDFKHNMECVLYLIEYMERHPDQRDILRTLALENRLTWGATYTQPYENMLFDEALVRQVYMGKKWVKKTFPGTDPKVAWSPDVPARAMQFPQILAKAGIDYLMISRINAGAFMWYSPDGSSVKGYSTGFYFTSAHALNADTDTVVENVRQTLVSAQPHFEQYDLPLHYLFLSVEDYAAPRNYRSLIEQLKGREDVPAFEHSTVEEYMDILMRDRDTGLKTYTGERPNEWAYIHGATHRKGVDYGRRASVYMPAAEMFCTVNALIENNLGTYPGERIEEGWKYILYPDHGFGGANGHITDQVFENALKKGYRISKQLLDGSLTSIAQKISVKDGGLPVVVFNAYGQPRSDIVRFALDIRDVKSRYFAIVDGDGGEVEYQITGEENPFELMISFLAQDVPSVGYKTYYVRPTEQATRNVWLKETQKHREARMRYENKSYENEPPLLASEFTVDNEFYTARLVPGGIASIYDKALKQELVDSTHINAFEVYVMHSEGTGAGEFGSIQQADMSYFDRMQNYDTQWEIVEDGSLRTTYKLESKFSFCHVVQRIAFYKCTKKIDCDIELISFDGTIYKEFRMAMPLALVDPEVSYDVPMGTVRVGTDEEKTAVGTDYFRGAGTIQYTTPCNEIHPREVLGWICAGDDNAKVCMSCDVSMFDYKSPFEQQDTMLSPILLVSRKSCHGWGNEYLQRGTHQFHFSFASGIPNDAAAFTSVKASHLPLTAVPVKNSGADMKTLPEMMSFIGVDKPNIIISAFKKCEDDDSVIVRMYENDAIDTVCRLDFFGGVKSMVQTNIIEEHDETSPAVDVHSLHITHHSIETYKIVLED